MSFQLHYAELRPKNPRRRSASTRLVVAMGTFVIALGCIVLVDLFAGTGSFIRGLLR